MTKEQLAQHLLEIKAVSVRDRDHLFTWVSGIQSPIYCDNRMTISYPVVRKKIYQMMSEWIQHHYPEAEMIAGTATAGIPHAAWVSEELSLPMLYVRGGNKVHGKGNQIEGDCSQGKTAILIEDLLSTGSSSVAAVRALQESGIEVLACVAIFTYGFQKVNQAFESVGVPYHTLTDYPTLIKIAMENGYIEPKYMDDLRRWQDDPTFFTDQNEG